MFLVLDDLSAPLTGTLRAYLTWLLMGKAGVLRRDPFYQRFERVSTTRKKTLPASPIASSIRSTWTGSGRDLGT